MKAFIFLLILPYIALAQTTENAAVKLTYIGYYNNQYHAAITNKQSGCPATVSVNWNSRRSDSTIDVKEGSTVYAAFPADYIPGSTFKIKTNNTCIAGANSGWISIMVPMTLAVAYEEFKVYRYFDYVKINWKADFKEGEYLEIEKSSDGKHWLHVLTTEDPFATSYLDIYPLKGKSFYRIKFVSASVSYSPIKAVRIDAADSGNIYNLSGQYVGNNLNQLPKGIYIKDGAKICK